MILDVGDKVTKAVAAFDEKKFFSHAAFKESDRLRRSYCFDFVNWQAIQRSTKANVCLLPSTHMGCFLSAMPHVALFHCQR